MDHSNQRTAKTGGLPQTPMPCGLPNNFPAHVAIVDPDGRIAYASNKLTALLGADRPNVVGQNFARFLLNGSDADIMSALLGDQPISDVNAVLHLPDGSTLTAGLSADRWLDPDGKRYRVIVITHVPDLQQADADIQKRSYRLQSCLEGTNAGTWEWNVQTGETRFNDRWAEIVGYRLDELEPVSIDTWLNLAHPDDLPNSSEKLELHFAGKEPFYDIDSRMRHKNGHDVWVRDRGRVFTWTTDGKPEWMFGTHFLIDCEKRAEVEQHRNRAMLDRVGRMTGVGGWQVEIETGQLLWSDETRRIHGVDESYVPSLEEGIRFYAPEARPIITKAVENGMASGEAWDLELPLIRMNGERIWVQAIGEVEFEGGKPKRIIGAFQDITSRVHDRNELIAAKEWTTYAAAKGRVGLWSLDTILGELNWDAQMASHFGFQVECGPKTVSDWLGALSLESRSQLKSAIRNSMFSGADLDLELSLDMNGGEQRFLKLVGAPHLDQDNNVDRLQGACFDLTEHRQMTARLAEQASKLSVTLSSIGDGVITADEFGCVTWMNPEAEKITGKRVDEVVGMKSSGVLVILNEKTRNAISCPIERCLEKRAVVILEHDSVLLRSDGTEVAISDSVAPLFDSENRINGAVMVFRDASAQRIQARGVAFRASHDSLTGLLNREAFLEQLDECLADPLKQNGSYLFFIDLDHFKRINDSVGHGAGDAVLACIADVLRESVDQAAAVARLGGDEFSILLRAKTKERAKAIGQEICRRAAESSCLKRSTDKQISIGTSIGIVSLAKQKLTSAEALKMADIAAYSAKTSGRGQACFWNERDSNMTAMSRQTSLISLIETAISDNGWTVQEQCIQRVEATEESGAFAELLIRLPDGNGGMIPPCDFLPAAERYGLMQEIDLWMCMHALDRIAASFDAGVSKIYSVNISASSVNSENFKQRVIEILSDTPAEIRQLLCFEVTETAVLMNYEACRAFLENLRSLGASVAIDDFGAGSTSFRHFQNLPADYLKIDGSFIQNMNNPIEAASIECFLRMANVANLKTIAEHVEDEEQIVALAALKVDFLQGYALGRPH